MDKDKKLPEEQVLDNTVNNFKNRMKGCEYPTGQPLPIIEKTPEEQKRFNKKFVELFGQRKDL
jgi:hypothetical protein